MIRLNSVTVMSLFGSDEEADQPFVGLRIESIGDALISSMAVPLSIPQLDQLISQLRDERRIAIQLFENKSQRSLVEA